VYLFKSITNLKTQMIAWPALAAGSKLSASAEALLVAQDCANLPCLCQGLAIFNGLDTSAYLDGAADDAIHGIIYLQWLASTGCALL